MLLRAGEGVGWDRASSGRAAQERGTALGEWRLEVEEGLEPSVSWLLQEAAAKTELEAEEIYLRKYLEQDKRGGCRTGQGNPPGCVSALTSMEREIKRTLPRGAGLSQPRGTGSCGKISCGGAPVGPSQSSPSGPVLLSIAGGSPRGQWSQLQVLKVLQLWAVSQLFSHSDQKGPVRGPEA